ncbi:hypothetical protein B0H19DRAFT_1256912 [Mycena capillaripes]|nr:hypothetical protein B0H19DRAFT_1256912 [Mycena capillaripes]
MQAQACLRVLELTKGNPRTHGVQEGTENYQRKDELAPFCHKWSAHRDLVEEATQQIKAGKPTHEIRLDVTILTLRNRSLHWVVQVIEDVRHSTIINYQSALVYLYLFCWSNKVTQAFEMCCVGNWNLSHVSLTSLEALAGLRNLRKTNPTLHAALSQTTETDPTSEAPYIGDGDDSYQGGDV